MILVTQFVTGFRGKATQAFRVKALLQAQVGSRVQ
jgi:hypothetical protein